MGLLACSKPKLATFGVQPLPCTYLKFLLSYIIFRLAFLLTRQWSLGRGDETRADYNRNMIDRKVVSVSVCPWSVLEYSYCVALKSQRCRPLVRPSYFRSAT